MILPSSRLARVAGSLVVVGAAAGITLGVTTLLGVTFQGSGEAQVPLGAQLKEGLLLTANRDRLAICVQAVGVDSSLEAKAKSAIETALVEVAKHPRWEATGLGVASPVVDIGCPSGPASRDLETQFVTEPSFYRLFVFVLPQEEFDVPFAGLPRLRTASQEVVCEGDSCGEVTSGLYIHSGELGDVAFLTDALAQGVGLELPY